MIVNIQKGCPKLGEIIKKDKSKNIIHDKKIGDILIREQILKDFPPKELRGIIDQGKKEIKSGVIISISTFEGKVGVAIGVSQDLTIRFDAVTLVKTASVFTIFTQSPAVVS